MHLETHLLAQLLERLRLLQRRIAQGEGAQAHRPHEHLQHDPPFEDHLPSNRPHLKDPALLKYEAPNRAAQHAH